MASGIIQGSVRSRGGARFLTATKTQRNKEPCGQPPALPSSALESSPQKPAEWRLRDSYASSNKHFPQSSEPGTQQIPGRHEGTVDRCVAEKRLAGGKNMQAAARLFKERLAGRSGSLAQNLGRAYPAGRFGRQRGEIPQRLRPAPRACSTSGVFRWLRAPLQLIPNASKSALRSNTPFRVRQLHVAGFVETDSPLTVIPVTIRAEITS